MGPQRRDWTWWVVGLLLAVHGLCAAGAAQEMSVTHDEYWHLPAGVCAWKSGRFDVDHLNPPLTRMWCAAPLLAETIDVDWKTLPQDATKLGDAFLQAFRGDSARYHALFFRARLMNVLFSVLTGLLLAVWARAWFGNGAACITALLWSCCPTAVANAALVTPDMAATLLFVAALYAAWRFAKQPAWSRGMGLGVLLGLAQLAKFTNVLLFPLVVIVWWLARFRVLALGSGTQNSKFAENAQVGLPRAASPRILNFECLTPVLWKQCAGRWMGVFTVCLLVWNVGYLFQGTGASLGSYRFQSRTLREVSEALAWLSWCPVPLPRDYVEGLDHQRLIMEGEHPVFLDMEWRTTGFRSYFLKSLAYKLPHATQLLILVAAVIVCVNRRSLRGREEIVGQVSQLARIQEIPPPTGKLGNLPHDPRSMTSQPLRKNAVLLIPAVVLIGIASLLRMQLGIRYILPALPLLYLFASQAAQWVNWRENRWRSAVVGIACALLPLSLRYHPHHLAYFNEYAGGPIDGRYHLLDSNLDWGQDLRELKVYLDRHRMAGIGLAYFGMVPPEFEGIAYQLPPSGAPLAGWYAVSVNFVLGRPHTVRIPGGEWRPVGIGEFSYFSELESVDRVGYSIDIYHVRESNPAR